MTWQYTVSLFSDHLSQMAMACSFDTTLMRSSMRMVPRSLNLRVDHVFAFFQRIIIGGDIDLLAELVFMFFKIPVDIFFDGVRYLGIKHLESFLPLRSQVIVGVLRISSPRMKEDSASSLTACCIWK